MSGDQPFSIETRRENSIMGRAVLKDAVRGEDGQYRYGDKTAAEWLESGSSREAMAGGGSAQMESGVTIAEVLEKLNSGELQKESNI